MSKCWILNKDFLWLDWSLWQEQIDFLWQIYIISYIFILQVYYDKINLQNAWPSKLKHILTRTSFFSNKRILYEWTKSDIISHSSCTYYTYFLTKLLVLERGIKNYVLYNNRPFYKAVLLKRRLGHSSEIRG